MKGKTMSNTSIANVSPMLDVTAPLYAPTTGFGRRTARVMPKMTNRHVKSLAGIGAEAMILVLHATGDKGENSIAQRNYPLYGKLGVPTVSVAKFISLYPAEDRGVDRAIPSIAWDVCHGYIAIVRPNGDVLVSRETLMARQNLA